MEERLRKNLDINGGEVEVIGYGTVQTQAGMLTHMYLEASIHTCVHIHTNMHMYAHIMYQGQPYAHVFIYIQTCTYMHTSCKYPLANVKERFGIHSSSQSVTALEGAMRSSMCL